MTLSSNPRFPTHILNHNDGGIEHGAQDEQAIDTGR